MKKTSGYTHASAEPGPRRAAQDHTITHLSHPHPHPPPKYSCGSVTAALPSVPSLPPLPEASSPDPSVHIHVPKHSCPTQQLPLGLGCWDAELPGFAESCSVPGRKKKKGLESW